VGDFKIPRDAIRGKHVKNDGLTGKDISEKTLNPNKLNAGSLDGLDSEAFVKKSDLPGLPTELGAVPAVRAESPLTPESCAPFSIPNDTETPVPFAIDIVDLGNLHQEAPPPLCDPEVQGELFTAPIDGLYAMTATVRWEANDTGSRYAEIRIDGAPGPPLASNRAEAVDAAETHLSLSTLMPLGAGQSVELVVAQTSGTELDLFSGTNFTMQWEGPASGLVQGGA
jgi:hypothetical protein